MSSAVSRCSVRARARECPRRLRSRVAAAHLLSLRRRGGRRGQREMPCGGGGRWLFGGGRGGRGDETTVKGKKKGTPITTSIFSSLSLSRPRSSLSIIFSIPRAYNASLHIPIRNLISKTRQKAPALSSLSPYLSMPSSSIFSLSLLLSFSLVCSLSARWRPLAASICLVRSTTDRDRNKERKETREKLLCRKERKKQREERRKENHCHPPTEAHNKFRVRREKKKQIPAVASLPLLARFRFFSSQLARHVSSLSRLE